MRDPLATVSSLLLAFSVPAASDYPILAFPGAEGYGRFATGGRGGDGIPDEWEQHHGLDPNNKSDGNGIHLSPDGYTNLEMYLNELSGNPVRWK